MHVQLQTPEPPETAERELSIHDLVFRFDVDRDVRGFGHGHEVIASHDVERLHWELDELVALEDGDFNDDIVSRFTGWCSVVTALKVTAGVPSRHWPNPDEWRKLSLQSSDEDTRHYSGETMLAELRRPAEAFGPQSENGKLWPCEKDIRGFRHDHDRIEDGDVEELQQLLDEIVELEDEELNHSVGTTFRIWRALLVALKVSRGVPTPEWPEPARWFEGCRSWVDREPRLLKEGGR